MTQKRPVLIVLHQERSNPGRVGQILRMRGFPLDIRRPVLGQALPATLADHSGAVIFGGPPSANDPDPYIRSEIDWCSVPLAEGKPFLGICLGAQMLARHLGAAVGPRGDGQVEIGWYPLRPTNEGRALMEWPSTVYQWHREGIELPAGAVAMAESGLYPNQAFRYGENAWGVQFHGELTLAMMHRWTTRGDERFTLPNAKGRRAHLQGRLIHDAPLKEWLDRFLDLVFIESGGASPDTVDLAKVHEPA